MTSLIPVWRRLNACCATLCIAGIYGTADSSHVLAAWIFAMAWSPRFRAVCQWRVARGPGPTEEIEYSPTALFTPPRSMGRLHSLTLMSDTPVGRRLIASGAQASFQPQSQTNNSAPVFASAIPRWISVLTSAITSAGCRLLQREHSAPRWCDQQFVRFSDAVIVKKPPSSGTARQMEATELVRYSCTSAWLVQRVENSPSLT